METKSILLVTGLLCLLWSSVSSAQTELAHDITVRTTSRTEEGSLPPGSGPSPWYSAVHQAVADSLGPTCGCEAVLGSPGKNIWAHPQGDTVLVVYGQPSGDPNNICLLWMAYSYDRGHHWENATSTIGPGAARRIHPGVTSPYDTLAPYLAYQHALHDGSNYICSHLYFSYDEWFPFMFFTPTRIDTGMWWLPSIATTAEGDTILISAVDTITGVVYIYRFIPGQPPERLPMIQPDTTGSPGAPRIALGLDGYVFGLFPWYSPDRCLPYYVESLDCGETWSDPEPACYLPPPWTCVCYDVALDPHDNDRPHCTVELDESLSVNPHVYEVHPATGGPGNWTDWTPTVLVGDAIQPTIGRDPDSNFFVTYSAFYVHASGDTFPEIGLSYSTDRGATWIDYGPLTQDSIWEWAIELADNVSDCLHILYVKEKHECRSLWHLLACPATGIEEQESGIWQLASGNCLLHNFPNPFGPGGTTIQFKVQSANCKISLRVYDLAGRLVTTLLDNDVSPNSQLPTSVFWDGKDSQSKEVPTGIYFCRFSSSHFTAVRKITILR